MHQLSLRIHERLADRLKQVAAERGESVNAYAGAVLAAAVDPELAGDETEQLRERLARAGLMETQDSAREATRPEAAELERARRAAGGGRKLSDLVGEGRR